MLVAGLGAATVVGCGATSRNASESEDDSRAGSSSGATAQAGLGGAAAGLGGTAPDMGAAAAQELMQACAQLGKRWCERIEGCSPPELASRYGHSTSPDATSCEIAERERCFDWFSRVPGVANGVEAVLAAAPTTCAEAFDYYLPYRTGAAGELMRGAACKWSEQCASGYCARALDELCGECDFVPPGVEPQPGQPCAEGACPTPFVCHAASDTCVQPPGEGEPCLQLNETPSPYDYCAESLICAAGTCVTPLYFGAPCEVDDDHCDVRHGLACQAGKCDLAAPLHVEGPCGGYPPQGSCGTDDTCVFIGNPAFDDRPGRCAPRKTGAGTPCTGPTDCPFALECVPSGDFGLSGGAGSGNSNRYVGLCRPDTLSASCE